MAVGYFLAAKRYGKALVAVLDVAKDGNRVLDVVESLKGALERSPELRNFFSSVAFNGEEKSKVILELADRFSAPETLRKFLAHLAKANRVLALPALYDYLLEVLGEKLNLAIAYVDSAKDLSEGHMQTLQQSLAKATNKNIRLVVRLNPELLAGLRVRVGNRTWDNSLSNGLKKLERELLGATA